MATEYPDLSKPEFNLSLDKARRKLDASGFLKPELAIPDVCVRQAISAKAFLALQRGTPALTIFVVPGQDWLAPVAAFTGKCFRRRTLQRVISSTVDKGKALEKSLQEAIRSFSSGASMILVTDNLAVLPTSLVTTATVVTISSPSPSAFRKLARLSFSSRVPPHTALDLSPLSLTEMLSAMVVGSSAASVVKKLNTLLEHKAVRQNSSEAPLLQDQPDGEAKQWGRQLVQDLDDYRQGRISWDELDKGCILAGEPGTGKTLLVHSIAQACRVPLVKCSIADVFATDGYLHSTIQIIQSAFEEAVRVRPAILFFDELDSLPSRGSSRSSKNQDYWNALMTAFLMALDDGTPRRQGVVVIGATNRPRSLDPALLRPGRFEKVIEVGSPDARGRERVLRHHLKTDLAIEDLSVVAKLTTGMTPADIMELVRNARRNARQAKTPMQLANLVDAVSHRSLAEGARERVALHEAGHGFIAHVLDQMVLADISLIPLGETLGSAGFQLTVDTRIGLEALVTTLLAGLAAELEFLGNAGSGAGGAPFSDLGAATNVLASIHASLGLGDSLVWRADMANAAAVLNTDNALRKVVQSDLKRLLGRARQLIRDNSGIVRSIADALIEHLVLTPSEVAQIVAKSQIEKPQP